MRPILALLSVLFVASLTSSCDDAHDFDRVRSGTSVRERTDEAADDFEAQRAELEERLADAEAQIEDELDSIDEDDLVTREELERLREKIETSSDRFQDNLDDVDENLEVAMKDLGKALEKIGAALKEDSNIEPVDHRKLRDLLPREVAGMERYDTDGSTSNVVGVRTSKVEGKYDGGPGDMSVSIVDLGSISGAAAAGLDMLDVRIDRDYDEGYQRTTKIDGYSALVTMEDNGGRRKRAAVIRVTDRFIVAIEAEGRDLPDDLIDQVVDRISLRRLARLGRR